LGFIVYQIIIIIIEAGDTIVACLCLSVCLSANKIPQEQNIIRSWYCTWDISSTVRRNI